MSIESLGYYLGIGIFHGLNPAMGWLFSVALALQHNSFRWIIRSAIALLTGHFLSIGSYFAFFLLLGKWVSLQWIKWIAVIALFSFAFYWLIRARHPKWVGMNVGVADLIYWSFLMASAHGAGLMLLVGSSLCGRSFAFWLQPSGITAQLFIPPAIHTLGYFLAVFVIATIVYRSDLLKVLYRKWINFDLLWSAALFAAGSWIALN
ncbi:hypothetical protein A7K93_10800 [Candidatus Methylacidiphilum fumarolicum]|uniref:Lysine transporter LysE n=2 Tax=Candidatus Methylacidiphilum fumarolicum TaxID=591154 RepID=I0JYL0_METFB|nr:hypothetical protein [Candidatus Methylacidiphilum fumarolicum]MBW6415497.1 hypothetical protein [Candidatus Methylacidiphilum fumarolicum]TFE66083.1 hypothetical protein A7K73_10720 [Candidatus Methylacidiphilum fumarolicum]TFE71361.1 hypothetical protein A7K72_11095 [Candidatus Methylacidiphilum fumarolicum]TFE71455.1 hypothetical protein A7K93_10800 [Candidatus Methylacidiphilum fumarolicum]TFE74965.1 hypothetical protein A7D33_11100 [Candidatus Methylacidiphilum fumarolicum]